MQGQRDATYAGMLTNAGLTDVAADFARHVITHRYGPEGWQDDIPPFKIPEASPPEPSTPNTPGAPGGTPSRERFRGRPAALAQEEQAEEHRRPRRGTSRRTTPGRGLLSRSDTRPPRAVR